MTTPRPRGRRPGNSDTRASILAAALTLFSETGYEKVSLRAIARSADVDPALIHHYFENKADLFARAVLDRPVDAEDLVRRILDGPVDSIGQRTVNVFFQVWAQPGESERFTAMLRAAAADDSVRRPLSEFIVREVLAKVAESLGHPDALLRAQIGWSQMLGFALARNILELPALTRTRTSVLAVPLGRAMQASLVEA